MPIKNIDVESASEPGKVYPMVLTRRGWEHADAGCRWAMQQAGKHAPKPCRHIADAEKKVSEMSEVTEQEEIEGEYSDLEPGADVEGVEAAGPASAEDYKAQMEAAKLQQHVDTSTGEIIPYGPAQALMTIEEMVDEFDVALITDGVDVGQVEAWCYTFRQDGKPVTGLSIWGVVNAVREMAKRGEVVKCDAPQIVFENDDEIRMSCTARRGIIDPRTSTWIELDTCTRGLRQTKFQMVNVYEGSGNNRHQKKDADGNYVKERRDDPKWWEKAYSKAQRNAQLPLIREDARTAILAAYRETEKYAALAAGRPYDALPAGVQGRRAISAPASRQAPRQARETTPAPPPADEPPHPAESAPAAPAAAPAPPKEPAQPITPSAEVLEAIADIMSELKDTWDKNSYRELWDHVCATYAGGEKLALMKLTVAQASGLLSYLRQRRGDRPAEDAGSPAMAVTLAPDDQAE